VFDTGFFVPLVMTCHSKVGRSDSGCAFLLLDRP
jgi:hypothetical protein